MKKSLLALAALTAFTGVASAQSSVTLFGVVDVAARHVKNGSAGSRWTEQSSGFGSSQLGFRGTEDLGNGTSAKFWLEADLGPDTGAGGSTTQAGQFFSRQSWVGLSNVSLGEVRLGRDYVPTHRIMCGVDPFNCNGVASAQTYRTTPATAVNDAFNVSGSAFAQNQSTLVRANNAVEYFLPSNLGGLTGSLMLAAGEGGSSTTGSSKVSAGSIGYAAGPLMVSIGATVTRNTLVAGQSFKDYAAGASYDFGVVQLMGSARQFKIGSAKLTQGALALTAPVGPGLVKAQFIKANQSGTANLANTSGVTPTVNIAAGTNIGGNDSSLIGLGYQYNLSKRTSLYGQAARIKNKGNAAFAITGGPNFTAAGQSSTGYEFGVRHNF